MNKNSSRPAAEHILKLAKEVVDTEIHGLQVLRDELDGEFVDLVYRILDILRQGGKIVLCGVGKSGHISKKIAATLASTGSRAVFMHPVEAMHGDLGLVSPNDIVLAVSYSGETDELLAVLPAVKRLGVPVAAITGKRDSRLAEWSDLAVLTAVPREACPFNLAPTTSTTALAAFGDALSMVLLECRRFGLNDYAKLHPAGAIGRSITLTVKDFMRTGDQAPTVAPTATVREALMAMTAARAGAVAIVDEEKILLGIFTDGDFRRRIMQDGNLLNVAIAAVMTPSPITISQDQLAVEILKIIENRKIDDIIAVDGAGHFAGLVDIQDLPKFKVM